VLVPVALYRPQIWSCSPESELYLDSSIIKRGSKVGKHRGQTKSSSRLRFGFISSSAQHGSREMDQANSCPVSSSRSLALARICPQTSERAPRSTRMPVGRGTKVAAVSWRHQVERHLQSSTTRDGKKTSDGKKKNEMTQVQLSTAQPVPSGIPVAPTAMRCCCCPIVKRSVEAEEA
jgi:hypothetical protein